MSMPELEVAGYKRFPKEEYEARWKKARKLMEKSGLDALLVCDGPNYTYLSGGTRDFSYTRPTIFILPRENPPTVIIHEFFKDAQKREVWVEDVRVYTTLLGAPIDEIKKAFEELGLTKSKVGAELGFEQRLGVSYNDFEALKKELPNVKFADASKILWYLRMVKSKAEIERMRKACEITSRAYDVLAESIREGMTEAEVAKILYKTVLEEGGASPWALTNSGPYNYDVISAGPVNKALRKGNLFWIDSGCAYKEYNSDFSRIYAIGQPSEKQKRMHETVCRITRSCIEAVRPGVKVSDIARLCDREFQKARLEITFRAGRIGHGVGMMVTEPPHIAKYDDTVLEPGMVITIEPGVVTDYGCFHVEENVLVTEKGYEILSRATTELRVV